MAAYYALLREIHIACAALTIALFVLRGALMMRDSAMLRTRVLRTLPHVIDTVLLATAVMLTMIIHQYPFANSWLTVKVGLLVVYIVLGSIALRRGRTRRVRIVAFVAALIVFMGIVSVAVTHVRAVPFARVFVSGR